MQDPVVLLALAALLCLRVVIRRRHRKCEAQREQSKSDRENCEGESEHRDAERVRRKGERERHESIIARRETQREQREEEREQREAEREQRKAERVAREKKDASQRVMEFWRALPNVHLSSSHGQEFLTLPPGVYWMGLAEMGRTIMVRQHYRDLYEQINSARKGRVASDSTCTGGRVVLLGSPGTGKDTFDPPCLLQLHDVVTTSRDDVDYNVVYIVDYIILTSQTMFACYILWRACTDADPFPVVWEPERTVGRVLGYRILFKPGEIPRYVRRPEATDIAFEDELGDKRTWYIVDGHTPGRPSALTLLITSPELGVWENFQQQSNARIVYMPPWLEGEIHACHRVSHAVDTIHGNYHSFHSHDS
ncbi:hypothetical protein KIPB_011860 [Kipferlia bialata]|uniref:P-loop containing nucleoside triphosphate hydrolase n=1 Tax=Kipferlia bialata TaxID=797122 RepID=A0A391NX99_9EUKA|nr:hypothetical protein KIPB_011860 [Kipferlia bialata]|eukprot:g11860.t1